ncbi:MAG: hypothetical protein ACRDQZ_24920, partial [Mycobacteriales bacterium]
LMLGGQEGRYAPDLGARSTARLAPWGVYTLGPPLAYADRVRLVVMNRPGEPLPAITDTASDKGNELVGDERTLAFLVGSAPVAGDTVGEVTKRLKLMNPGVIVLNRGDVPATIERPAVRTVLADELGKLAGGASRRVRGIGGRVTGEVKRRRSPPSVG